MYLPDFVKACIDSLESAGFYTYAVGGCVRDSLLGLTPHDYDLCTEATPEQICQTFQHHRLVLAGIKHGTVAVITHGGPVEITTFRLEGDYRDNRHPGWVRFVSRIEDDLSRRDFTVNAIAYSPYRGFADPFGGQSDLKNRCLRAVGNPTARFREDALRILRGVRFAVRYGLIPDEETEAAMTTQAPLMDHLARERVFDELCKLLPLVNTEDLLRCRPILTQILPELAPMVDFDQHSPYHAYDLFTHTAHVTGAVPPSLPLRWAALLHDIGKPGTFYLDEDGRGHFPGHAKRGEEMADHILRRLKAPNALREQVTALIARHMTPLEPDRKLLRRRLGKYGMAGTLDLLALQKADFSSKGCQEVSSHFQDTLTILQQLEAEQACLTLRDLAVNGRDLLQLGFHPGPEIGACLNRLFLMVQDETLPNSRDRLLQAAADFKSL